MLLDAVGESTFEIWLAPLQLLTDGYAVDAVGAADQAKIRPAEDVALPSESSPLLVAGRAEGAGAALRDWIEAKSNWGDLL